MNLLAQEFRSAKYCRAEAHHKNKTENNIMNKSKMNKTVALQFFGAVGVSLALLSTAASGTCPTAKTGQTNCGPTQTQNCNQNSTIPTSGAPAGPQTCVAVSTQNNRAPGICTNPNNQANKCDSSAGSVAVTYTEYKTVTYTNPTSCDCNIQVVVYTGSNTVDCPVTSQDANPSTDCSNS